MLEVGLYNNWEAATVPLILRYPTSFSSLRDGWPCQINLISISAFLLVNEELRLSQMRVPGTQCHWWLLSDAHYTITMKSHNLCCPCKNQIFFFLPRGNPKFTRSILSKTHFTQKIRTKLPEWFQGVIKRLSGKLTELPLEELMTKQAPGNCIMFITQPRASRSFWFNQWPSNEEVVWK